jgi:hypothetical protein
MPTTFSRQLVGASGFPQRGSFTIILELNDRMILNPLHDLVDCRKGCQKPLVRQHRISKTVSDYQVETHRLKKKRWSRFSSLDLLMLMSV